MEDVKLKIQQAANMAVADYVKQEHITTKYGEVLIGYADATDGLFAKFNSQLKIKHPKEIFSPGKTVVAFYVPFDPSIGDSNVSGETISEEWANAYKQTVLLTALISDAIKDALDGLGRESSLTITPGNWSKETFQAEWSHRHAAYVAGLGTFGIHRGLITEKGCCGRYGSIITDLPIEPTNRPEMEFCLSKQGKNCDKCIVACPVGAITNDSLDKAKCYEQCLKNEAIYENCDACGKCMVGKPCSK